jgi:cobalt-zinc-cadmium efflux system outer membrane protein
MILTTALILVAAPLHLAEALEQARARNFDLRASREQVQVFEAAIEAAGQLTNPTLALSKGPDDPTFFATLDVKLPILGQRGTAIAAAERERDVALAERAALELRILVAVRRAYFAVAAAQERASRSEDAVSLARQLAELTARKVQTGTGALLEARQAELAVLRAEQDHALRVAELATAREELGTIVGAPGAEVEVADPLLPLPDVPPLEALLDRAQRHPEVQSLRRQEDAALARAQRERAAVRPIPDVSIELEKLSTQTALGVRAGLTFDLPILTWNGGRVHEAQAQARVAGVQLAGARRRLQGQIRAARSRWDAAATRARSAAGQVVPAARELVSMARSAWELGRAPLFVVLQAQSDLASAQAQAADAAEAAQRAFADLEEATGEAL